MFDDPPFKLNKLTQKDLIQWILDNRPLLKRPNNQTYYSNIGYMLLGRVIEKLSGETYFAYVKKNIMDPIGVTTFSVAPDSSKDKLPNEVSYYPLEFRSSPYNIKVARADSAFGMAISPIDCVQFAYHWM